MSNYPPTPSFGGPFSVASRIPSSSSVAGHNDSQRYQGVTNTLHMPQEAQSKATTNTYPFGQNAQAMNFEGFGSGVPPPFLSLARFPPGSLPPPPFPPVPIPQNGFPAQFSIPSRRADLLPNPPQNIKVQQTKNLHLPPRPNADYSAQRSLAATSEGEREEGELSDMEVKDTTGYGIQVSGPQSEHQPPSPKFALNQSSQIGSYAGENNTRPREQDNSLTFRRPEEPRTVGENSRERRGSGSLSQKIQAPSPASRTHDLLIPINGHSPPSRSSSETYLDKSKSDNSFHPQSTGQRYSPTIGKSVTNIRKLAKSALLGLLPHSIRYADLVAAGVDENTLRSLYEEIGVKIPPKTPPPITVNDMGQKSSVERPALNGNDSNKGDDGKHRYAPLTQPPPPQPPTPPISANIHQPVQATKVSTELSSAAPADAVIKRPEGIAVAKGTVVKDVPSLSRPKVPAVDSSQAKVMPSSKTMERKDYIARMLAAKAGKLPASPAQSTQAPPLVSAQSKKVNDEENVTASFTVPSREKDKVIESPVTTPKTTDSEAIKQAQTNLARQKMEALRNRTPANSERLGPSQSGPPTSQTALTTQPVSETSTSIQAQHITPVQSSDGQPPPKSNDASQSSSGSSGTLRPDEANISMASFSGIPGLFMTSAPSPRPQVTSSHPILEPGSSNSSTINPVGNSRKRPLAADLNDLASNSIKRPFGQSRQIAVVIDVSDDEAADVYDDSEMDLEDDEEVTVPKQTQTTRGSSMLRGQRNSPVTNDIPVKKPVAATSTLNTPSASQTPGIVKQPGDLKTTEKQIQLMHQRIAELEQRRKSKQINSRAETPGTPEPVAATPNAAASPPNTANELKVHERDAQPLNEDFNEKGEAEKIRIAQAPVTQDMTAVEQQKTIDAQTDRAEAEQIERAKVEAKQVEQALVEAAEQKRRRKAEIEFGLPILDAEVVRTQMKLEEMKKEVHRLEAEVQKGLEGRKSLIAELEGLGIDTEGMPLAELQAKKDEIMKQQTEDRDQGSARSEIASPPIPTEEVVISRPTERTNDAGPDGLADRHARSSTAEQPDKVEDLDWSDRSRQRTSEELVEQDSQDMMDISRSSAEEGEITNNSAQDMSDSTLARKTEHGIRSEEVVNGPADAISLSQPSRQSSRSSALSVEDDYAPDPAQLTPAYEASHTAEDQRPSEEPTAAGETQKKSPSRILADSSGKSNSSDEPDGSEDSDDSTDVPDSDNYEPPEPLSPANVKEADTTHPPVGPVSLDTNVEAEKRADDPAPSAVENPAPVALSQGAQPIEAIHNIEDEISESSQRKGHFVPYESPLKQFKSYRYHPKYISEVPGGFRSMTYSHNINADIPLCRYEAAGGICNDSTCDSQHFRNMGLSDDMILVQMGSVHEGRTAEEKDEYVGGLKQIIQDMRGRKVKDFNTVASEIAAYRTRFLKDASRILLL